MKLLKKLFSGSKNYVDFGKTTPKNKGDEVRQYATQTEYDFNDLVEKQKEEITDIILNFNKNEIINEVNRKLPENKVQYSTTDELKFDGHIYPYDLIKFYCAEVLEIDNVKNKEIAYDRFWDSIVFGHPEEKKIKKMFINKLIGTLKRESFLIEEFTDYNIELIKPEREIQSISLSGARNKGIPYIHMEWKGIKN